MNSWCSVPNIGRNTMYSMYMNVCVNKDGMTDDNELIVANKTIKIHCKIKVIVYARNVCQYCFSVI